MECVKRIHRLESEKLTIRNRAVLVGVGQIGLQVARVLAGREDVLVVGAVDVNPELRDRSLAEVAGCEAVADVTVAGSLDEWEGEADVAIHTTSSYTETILPLLVDLLERGLSVVTSAEEMTLPALRSSEAADELDGLARARGLRVVGVGVNPGFVMDGLPVYLSRVCTDVDQVSVLRVVDAATRRPALQMKVGAGMEAEDFLAGAEAGRLGHVGLVESAARIAEALGWALDEIVETVEPVIAEDAVQTNAVSVAAGQVAGIRHLADGMARGRRRVALDLRMYVGATRPRDEVHISGNPPLDVVIANGVAGDAATAATLVNTALHIHSAPPGLLSLSDMGVVTPRARTPLRLA